MDPVRDAAPDPRLPRPALPAHRPVEDFSDEIQLIQPGPLYDQGQTGQRQLLALDGLDPREGSLLLDGIDMGSRITGRSDLNLLNLEGLDPERSRWWQRRGSHAGGVLELSALRAADDSILTRIRWWDGFLGYIRVEGEFRRPVLGGRMLLGAGQTWTHERVPGAAFRGNQFFWNYDRPLAQTWLLRFDQRVIRNKHNLLELDTDGTRSAFQRLDRLRLQHAAGNGWLVEADVWQLGLRERITRILDSYDRERVRSMGLRASRHQTRGHLQTGLRAEQQRLTSADWVKRKWIGVLDADWVGRGRWRDWERTFGVNGELRWDRDHPERGGHLGVSIDLQRGGLWLGTIVNGGLRPASPEALYLSRDPALLDRVVSPWIRGSNGILAPDGDLEPMSWIRQELRGGIELRGPRQATVSARAWRVAIVDQPVEVLYRSLQPGVPDTPKWLSEDHVHLGAQLHAGAGLVPHLRINYRLSWFDDDRNVVSREFPTLLNDGWLEYERKLFGRELDVRALLGLHHEHGGVDSQGAALWSGPELWIKLSARRGPFTIWWSLRNPGGLADISRVEALPLPGHEEILGIRWNFIN